MSINRISTYGSYQRTVSDFSLVSQRLNTLQEQISSGVKAKTFKGMDGFVEQFAGLEAKQKKQQQFIDNNTESISRLQTQQQSVASMIDIATQMQTMIVGRRSANGLGGNVGFPEQLKSLTSNLTKQLNTSLGDRFLFGGSLTNRPPVIDPVPDTVISGSPDNAYYQGGSSSISIRADENFNMEMSVRADDPAFQKIYAAMNLARRADESNNDDLLQDAYDLLHEGLEGVITVQTVLNNDITTLKDINDQHQASNLYLKGVTEDIAKTDFVKASSQVAVDQTILQASFQTFSTISNLKLINFLK